MTHNEFLKARKLTLDLRLFVSRDSNLKYCDPYPYQAWNQHELNCKKSPSYLLPLSIVPALCCHHNCQDGTTLHYTPHINQQHACYMSNMHKLPFSHNCHLVFLANIITATKAEICRGLVRPTPGVLAWLNGANP